MTLRRWIYSLVTVLSIGLPLGVTHSAPSTGADVYQFRSSSAFAQVQADGLNVFFEAESEFFDFNTGEWFTAGLLMVEIWDPETGLGTFGFAILRDPESFIATDSLVWIPGDVEMEFIEFDPMTGELIIRAATFSDLIVVGDGAGNDLFRSGAGWGGALSWRLGRSPTHSGGGRLWNPVG